MTFRMKHKSFETEVEFSEHDAPDWLTGVNTVVGSTMDTRWFWKEHVLTLNVGDFVETEFQRILRIY